MSPQTSNPGSRMKQRNPPAADTTTNGSEGSSAAETATSQALATGAAVDDTAVDTGCMGNFNKQEQSVPDKDGKVNPKKPRKEKPFCIRMTMHPLFKLVPWALVGITPFMGLWCITGLLEKKQIAEWSFFWITHVAFAVWVCFQIQYNFMASSLLNPGFVTDFPFPPHSPKTGKYLMVCPEVPPKIQMDKETEMRSMGEGSTSESKDKEGGGKAVAGGISEKKFPMPAKEGERNQKLNLWYAPRLCPTCEAWKPPRSHHDSVTNRCVLR